MLIQDYDKDFVDLDILIAKKEAFLVLKGMFLGLYLSMLMSLMILL